MKVKENINYQAMSLVFFIILNKNDFRAAEFHLKVKTFIVKLCPKSLEKLKLENVIEE
jgi:hypothetical protein